MLKKILPALLLAFVAACGGGGKDRPNDPNDPNDPGELSDCAAAFVCVADCPTAECVESCLADISEATMNQMIALAECSEAAGCDSAADAEACLWESCGDEMDACGVE